MWKIMWTLLFLATTFLWFMTTYSHIQYSISCFLRVKDCRSESLLLYIVLWGVNNASLNTHTPLGTCHWIRPKHTSTNALGFQSKPHWAGRDRNLTRPYGANHTGAMPAKLPTTWDKTKGTIELIVTHKRSSWKHSDTQDIPQAMEHWVIINKHVTITQDIKSIFYPIGRPSSYDYWVSLCNKHPLTEVMKYMTDSFKMVITARPVLW